MPEARTNDVVAAADLAPHPALSWVSRLRYGIVAGEAIVILGITYGFRLKLPLLWTLAPLELPHASF
jgi:hypothetical protein